MSIADKIQRLQTAKTNIATAITDKGGTVQSGDGFEDFSADIASIPSGITPTGTISITANGTHDVTNYANASVNVPAKLWGVSVDNYYRTIAKGTPDLEDFVLNRDILPASFAYALRWAGLKSISLTGSTLYTDIGYAYARCFKENHNLESVVLNFGDRTSTWNNYLWSYAFENCGVNNVPPPYTSAYATFTMYCKSLGGNYAMQYMFSSARCFKYFAFPNTTDLNPSGYGTMDNCFVNCYQGYRENIGINFFRFPVLYKIGGTVTSVYGTFRSCFWCSQATNCHYGELIFPELVIISCRNSTATNGHFNGCIALNKIYLPKFNRCNASTSGTTYSKYLFNGCTNLTEIHFGIENQAAVEAMDGYATKFAATNATLYFDMPNHLTVGGVVYDRSGAEYDYDNSYYSWKNGTTVIYTTNAINPAVGDTVYTKNGDTYTASGTITAIA